LKHVLYIIAFFTLVNKYLVAQTNIFREKGKWGIKENGQVLIAANYDTIFNFDDEEKVCLACFKTKKAPQNKFIKTISITYNCNYLSKENKKLQAHVVDNDTCTVFDFNKHTVEEYQENPNAFTVMVANKKYLINKSFEQLTFKPYHQVKQSIDPAFYNVEVMEQNEIIYAGLIDKYEKEVIPHQFSMVKINPIDSLIYGCRAGLVENYYDDVFNYQGKKIDNYHRHIELPTKNFIIHKIFEPKETYVVYNIMTKQDLHLRADEVHFYEQDQLLIRIKNDWYVYDLKTNTKKEKSY
jgi:hypothetical protein